MSLAPSPSGTPARRALVAALSTVLLLSFVPVLVVADEEHNPGTIKVHDERETDPEQRNEPHVACDFWVEGFGMTDDSGTLVFYSWPPTGDKTEVLNDTWTGTEAEKKGFDFIAGPYNFTEGHYRVEAFVDNGHPGNDEQFSKTKTFWVDPCPLPPPDTFPCPEGLVVASAIGGGYKVSFTPADGSDATNVYRAVGDEDFELIATVPSTEDHYVDGDVETGVTYTYMVTGLFGNVESQNCASAEISSIPEFPTVFALAAAALTGTLAYAFVARRKP